MKSAQGNYPCVPPEAALANQRQNTLSFIPCIAKLKVSRQENEVSTPEMNINFVI